MAMNTKIIDVIKEYASKEAGWEDEWFNPMESSGGNYDDAYQFGIADGEIAFTRKLLALMKNDE